MLMSPQHVTQVAALYLTPKYEFVSTLGEDEVNTHQHGITLTSTYHDLV
jgi:hypothetical protein